ncbi:hypothetical protein [[Clostridium] symbiosum]|uniref:hypothetical protein n=1 Tax=Clostridium symbiosum TaxID=1512 RepID=UPI0034A5B1C3
MVTLEEAGYCFKIENSGRIYYLLIREEGEFIKFFLRKEKTFYWFKCYAGSIYNDFTREINVGNSILEEENTESIEGGKTTQIIKLALWYENKCLVHDAEYLDYLIGKLEEIKNDDSDIPN